MKHGLKKPLGTAFFQRDPVVVARELLGKVLLHTHNHQTIAGVITETEAYGGADDPASHAFRGKTARNWPMFEGAGLVYVYLIYGVHYCFNVTAGQRGDVGAVLIRSLLVLPDYQQVVGPGKAGKTMGFTRANTGMRVTEPQSPIVFQDWGLQPLSASTTARIGIRRGTDKPWRFTTTGVSARQT